MILSANITIWLAGISALIAMLSLIYTVHNNQKREHKQQTTEITRLSAGLTATRRQLDHLQDDHKSFKDDVSHALERVYDKIDSVHDLVVNIALKNKDTK